MRKMIINTMLILALALSVCGCGATKEVAVDQSGIKSAAKAISGKGAAEGTQVASTDSTVTVATRDAATTDATGSAEDYLIYKGVAIVPNADVAPVVQALGTPNSTNQYKYCGTDKIATDYYYDGLEIFTCPDDNGVNRIYMIRALDCQSSTAKGASLCQDLGVLMSRYGKPAEQTDDLLTYKYNGVATYFLLDDGTPVVILFSTLDE